MFVNKKRALWISVVTIAMSIVVLIGVMFYSGFVNQKISKTIELSLHELITQQAFNFTQKLESDMNSIKMNAIGLSDNLENNKENNVKLKEIMENSSFDLMIISDLNGEAYTTLDKIIDVSEREYFHEALKGKSTITDPIISLTRGVPVILMATPIYQDDKIVGVLAGTYLVEELQKLFLTTFDGLGYAYIVTCDGTIITRTINDYYTINTENAFDTFRQVEYYDGDSADKIIGDIQNGRVGLVRYQYEEHKRLIEYMPIGINEWVIMALVPDVIIDENANEIVNASILLSIAVAFVIIVLMLQMYNSSKKTNKKMREIAYVDELTKGPTLAKFKLDAQRLLRSEADKQIILSKFDISNFKMINKLYGYQVGDQVLVNIADVLEDKFRDRVSVFSRVNVDEFLMIGLYDETTEVSQTNRIFNIYIKEATKSLLEYSLFMPTGTYVFYPEDVDYNIATAIERVNYAHSEAKYKKIPICSYDEEIEDQLLRKSEVEKKMNEALENEEFLVYLQPKYEISTGKIKGAEALVRWQETNGSFVYPNDFIPIFEEDGFITTLDMYMFEKVCKIVRGWIDSNIEPVIVSVNFSRLHLNKTDFVEKLIRVADEYNVPHNLLEIELTESVIFQNEVILIDILEQLHQAGFTLSMDDFGVGYSSLGLLKSIPVDVIKIDKSFFNAAKKEKRARAVIANVIQMAKDIDIYTVAEGVELEEQVRLLDELGCDMIQGYYYDKPMPWEELTKKLQ